MANACLLFWVFPTLTALRQEALTHDLARIFVYDLPARISTTVLRDDDECEQLESGGVDESDCIFGPALDITLENSTAPLSLRSIDQFALGKVVYASLKSHPRRTHDHMKADLFFIPLFNHRFPAQKHCLDAEKLVEMLPHLTEDTAHRHLLLNPRPGWHGDVCELFNSRADSESPAARLLASVTKLALEDRVSAPGPHAERLHSVPYPALSSGLNSESVAALHQTISNSETRTYLIAAIWSVRSTMKSKIDGVTGKDERLNLEKQLKDSDDCVFVDAKTKHRSVSERSALSQKSTAAMLQATFCIEPIGDTTSRKGMVDAIVLGCIPVVFSRTQQRLWPWHVPWQHMSVLLDPDEPDVIGKLEAVPAATVQRMRTILAQVAQRLTYSPLGQPKSGDAVETLLHAVWRNAAWTPED